MPGVQVSKADLAHIFGVDQPTIDVWLEKGLPHIKKRIQDNERQSMTKELIFDTADAINWRLTVPNLSEDW
ncbi:MAG: terminase small subunit [Pseudomonadota bacterium]